MQNQQPPAEYAGVIGNILDKVKHNLKAHDQLLSVAFLINLEQGKIELVAGEFDGEDAKDYFSETVRQRASRMQAEAICFVSEAWTLPEKYSTQEHIDRIRNVYGSISAFPEREEIVMVSLETHDGLWMARSGIAPAKKGRKPTGFSWVKADGMTGRFAHLLPPRYATPQQVSSFLQLARYKMVSVGLNPDTVMEEHSLIGLLEKHVRNAPAAKLTEEVIDALIAAYLKVSRENGDAPPGAA